MLVSTHFLASYHVHITYVLFQRAEASAKDTASKSSFKKLYYQA